MGFATIRPSEIWLEDVRLVISGAPRTAKNTQRIARKHDDARTPFIIAGRSAGAWQKSAVLQLRSQAARAPRAPIVSPVNMRALVFREKRVGDLGNYLAAICDALELSGVVANDRWIMGFDGSRLMHDKIRPRVEIYLTALAT